MTALIIIIALILLIVLVLAVMTERGLNKQVEQTELEAHKELFPHQIWQARRSFQRNLLRRHVSVALLRNLAIGFAVVAALQLGLAGLTQGATTTITRSLLRFGQLTVSQTHAQGDVGLRNLCLWLAFAFILVAAILFIIFDGQLMRLVLKDNGDNARVLFWEKASITHQRRQLHVAYAIITTLALLTLAVAGQTGVLPGGSTSKTAVSDVESALDGNSSSASGTTVDGSSSSSSDNASSSASSDSTSSSSNDTETTNEPGGYAGGGEGSLNSSSSDIASATPVSQSVVDSISDADWATMFYMSYYSILGKDSYSLFSGAGASTPTYVQIVTNKTQKFFVYSYKISGKHYYTTYAYMNNGEVAFYSLDGITGDYTKLTDMITMKTAHGLFTPAANATSDTIDVAQIAGNYYKQSDWKKQGYDRVKTNLKTGASMTIY